jgi:hypothetical protein
MKRVSVFALVLLLASSFVGERAYTFEQCVGVYAGSVSDHFDVDSNITVHHVRIELLSDSTFLEIHDNFQCVGLKDFWGKWKVYGDSLKLFRLGDLKRMNGKYVAGETTFLLEPHRNSKAILRVESENSLIWIDETYLNGIRLKKE